ncbi:hypothetical protein BDV34DRAFT_222571 [Aspergillus parasiticus]|uniref:Cyanovirin-N domain-containing protein n=1 Tax=Aspergillus parasiticus TaxID=5067 RepID=A0A5N6DTP0_ASPPA|nr:hypothetical protein BDV34DRAFT_222571 [Aspergillus parasiticus]
MDLDPEALAYLNLNGTVINNNGVLSCFDIQGEKGPAPGPQDISTTRKFKRGEEPEPSVDPQQGGFYNDCDFMTVEHPPGESAWLRAYCSNSTEASIQSILKLDWCIGYEDSVLKPKKDGNAPKEHCQNCTLGFEGIIMKDTPANMGCECGKDHMARRVDLNKVVSTDEGYLSCYGRRGAEKEWHIEI